MATIIEKINKCWNSTTEIEKNDKITVYQLEKPAKLFSEVSSESWGKDSKDSNRLIIVKRRSRKEKLCRNEEMRDATDDVCTIISKWYDRLLKKYNEGLDESCQLNNIGELFKNHSDFNTERVRDKADELGLSVEELLAVGRYKRDRNDIVHKNVWNEFTSHTKDRALKSLEIASKRMSSECKIAVEKCINQLYN